MSHALFVSSRLSPPLAHGSIMSSTLAANRPRPHFGPVPRDIDGHVFMRRPKLFYFRGCSWYNAAAIFLTTPAPRVVTLRRAGCPGDSF